MSDFPLIVAGGALVYWLMGRKSEAPLIAPAGLSKGDAIATSATEHEDIKLSNLIGRNGHGIKRGRAITVVPGSDSRGKVFVSGLDEKAFSLKGTDTPFAGIPEAKAPFVASPVVGVPITVVPVKSPAPVMPDLGTLGLPEASGSLIRPAEGKAGTAIVIKEF